MPEHTHSWAVDPMQAGFSCSCGQSGWDWQQDEIRRLWDRLNTRTEEVNRLEIECAARRAELDGWRAAAQEEIANRHNRLEPEIQRLRAELATWQQRFGDCEATVLRLADRAHRAQNVINEARTVAEGCHACYGHGESWGHKCTECSSLRFVLSRYDALDAVPRRVASPESEDVVDSGPILDLWPGDVIEEDGSLSAASPEVAG